MASRQSGHGSTGDWPLAIGGPEYPHDRLPGPSRPLVAAGVVLRGAFTEMRLGLVQFPGAHVRAVGGSCDCAKKKYNQGKQG